MSGAVSVVDGAVAVVDEGAVAVVDAAPSGRGDGCGVKTSSGISSRTGGRTTSSALITWLLQGHTSLLSNECCVRGADQVLKGLRVS